MGDGLAYCDEINLEPMEHRHQAFFHTEKIVPLSKLTLWKNSNGSLSFFSD